MKDMNNYSTYDDNDYRAPWLRLNKEQMSDPFGWLLSQRNIDVRAILLKMGYNDRQIGFLLYPNQIADKKPGFLQARQRIGQKAVQTYLKWVFDNEVKKNKIKLGESQLRKIVAESVKKVLKEGYEPSGSYQPFEKDYKGISYETDIDKDRLHTLDIRRDGYGDGQFNPRTGKYEDSIEYYADGMPYPSIDYLEGHDDEWKNDRIYPELEGNKKLKESVEKAVKSVLKEYLNKK